MKSVIASLVAVAGLSVAASAAVNTQFDLLVSTTGATGTFTPNVNLAANSGIVSVQVLARVTYTGVTQEFRTVVVTDPGDPDNGTPSSTHTESHQFTPRGLSSLLFQPTVSNWGSTDTMAALANGGAGSNTSSPSGAVSNSAGSYGRISPWARTAVTGMTGFVHTGGQGGAPAGGWLRIAQNGVTNWVGVGGPANGTGVPNNTSGGSGVNIAQLAAIGRTGSDPSFVTAISNVAIFRFAVNVDTSTGARTLTIDAPLAGFGNLANPDDASSDREIYWWAVDRANHPTLTTGALAYQDIGESTGSFRGTAHVTDGSITVILPTPASLALLGLGGLVAGRRRR